MLLLDLYEETLPLLARAVVEAVGKSKAMPMGWKHVSKYLTTVERDKMRKDVAGRMVNIFRSLPSEDEFEASARAGQAKKGWYAASAKALMEVFGPDTPRFAALLASLSPQVSVKENLRNAIKFWERWIDAGRPTHGKDLDAVGHGAVGEERWEKMGWKQNANKTISATDPNKIVLSSGSMVGKVDSFRANLLGDLSRVTNDAWMAHFADVDQSLFGTRAGYLAMTAKIRRVAEKMGWTPAEVQETVWSFFKALHENQGPKQKGRKTLEKLQHSDVNDSSDFADLLINDQEVKDALQRLRNRNLVGEPTPRLRDGGQDPNSSPQSAAAQRGLAGSLARVADRAEALKHRQDTQELATRGYHFPNASEIRFGHHHVTFTLTDPREVAEWREKPRTAKDVYSLMLGRKDGKWDRLSGVAHGTPTVTDKGDKLVVILPFESREQIKPAEIDPEQWRKIEMKKQERAQKLQGKVA